MDIQSGTISDWREERGFGFITPKSGGNAIFAHINDYSRRHRPPFKGLEVNYFVSSDSKGRKCAVEIRPVKGHKINGNEWKQKTLSVFLFISFACVLYYLLISNLIPLAIVGIYGVMSFLAIAIYAKDKTAAEWGTWRTSESTLHLIALVGGWPGAAIAQSFLRHKSKKLSFRVTYWMTVIINCGVLSWLITPDGSLWLESVLKKVDF